MMFRKSEQNRTHELAELWGLYNEATELLADQASK